MQYIPGLRSTTKGSTSCHLVGTPVVLLQDSTMLSSGVEIIFRFVNVSIPIHWYLVNSFVPLVAAFTMQIFERDLDHII